ncbi:pentatricopeptide repeat-containing protein At4g02750-like isoform X2 [Cryptomeria japonica]|nr:pentatricopeptide repeat-containing protein At4g02750-like isoform X2 [Cryptomeria japonica]
MTERDVFSWNVMIAAYRRHGFPQNALTLFYQMQRTDVQPDRITFASILPACARMGALEQGIEIYEKVIECGFLSDVVIGNGLIDMFAKCGRIEKARELFDKMPLRNVFSWNMMIAGYTQYGFLNEASRLFTEMPQRDAVSWNAMITGYVQNGFIDEATRLFKEMPQPNLVSWNAMIAGFAQNELVAKALETFKEMQLAGVNPDSATICSILPPCAKLGELGLGMEFHRRIIEWGFTSDVIVVTALIDMYAKCGSVQNARNLFDRMSTRDAVLWTAMIAGYGQNGALDDALKLFNEMPRRDVVSWNAVIAGYVQNGLVEKAMDIFHEMQSAGVKPNSSTFVSILPACAKMGALEQGMAFHQTIIECRFLSNVEVGNALIAMYAKCGSLQKARKLFDKMHQPNVISWTAMIAGYAMHGYGKDALKLFELMKYSRTKPNHISFVCALYACSHAGLVDEGCKYYDCMSESYCITPTMDHYVCMVDLLGRAGYLEETLNFIIKMPIKPDMVVWMCFLSACRLHKNIELGEFAATLVYELDPEHAAPYVLLSDIYAEVCRWDDVQNVWKLMKDRGIKKMPGCSWIEVHKTVHVFSAGDRSHPQTQAIYTKLEELSCEMKAAGYILDSVPAVNNIEEEEKELFTCHHSEKLAMAFGLLNTPPGRTIRVVKNLRVCVDCHITTKFISKIVGREIVVRDANRFHHFKHGQCSCGDYW